MTHAYERILKEEETMCDQRIKSPLTNKKRKKEVQQNPKNFGQIS